jgi:hypothetical protein
MRAPNTTRRLFLASGCGLFAVGMATRSAGQTPGVQQATLREILRVGLKARLPREFRFIDMVVAMVDAGDLPLPLVMAAYNWARDKARGKKYIFPYFEAALRVLAGRQGIAV